MVYVQKFPSKLYIFCVMFILNNVDFIEAENLVCWESNLVPYTIGLGFSDFQRDYIKQQIAKINNQTCIYWSDMDESDDLKYYTSFVKFKRALSDYCQTSTIYPRLNKQLGAVVVLGAACFERKAVLHEILHALGFDHEQQRIDRDCYVWVSEDSQNTPNNKIDQFSRIPNLDRFPYDKESVMHYKRSTRLKALSERFYEWEPLGNKEERLTDLDVWKIQYRFCGWPHYCEVYPQHCRDMEREESEKNCSMK